ncbi:hypothetical protein GHT06_016983 [Daphnia sinensis]|uniref:Uncharacterized protein n=1 Tax=Daphnia sinensis TaxID=1820382 RepID=A0AAD5PRJ0_9CRUS|nr:hypothetical protein GHT06_016983 [Daphnia sinensis]
MKKARYRDLWQTARYKVLEASNRKKPLRFIGAARVLIMQKRELLKSKTEQLEWDHFRLLLHELPPPLEIAKCGRNHKLFAIDNDTTADALLTDVFEEFKLVELFHKQRRNLPLLMSYARQNSSKVLAEMRRILDKMVTEPINIMSNQTWRFNGCALLLSHIYNQWMSKKSSSSDQYPCEEIIIEASRVIYIDMDWMTPGLSLNLSAPRIEAVGTGIRRVIDTSGKDAKRTIPEKANDGRDAGLSGDDGEHGVAGQSAGHVSIMCATYLGMPLVIRARGGNGSDGQNGGDGKPGIDGQNGRDGKLPPKEEVDQDFDFIPLRYYWNFPKSVYQYYSGKIYNTSHLVPGEPGTPGKSGGSGGSGGCGGQGGFAGEVEINKGSSEPDPAKTKLIQFLRDKLIYSVAEVMMTSTSASDGNKQHFEETMIQSQVLTLKGLLQCCSLHLTPPDAVPVSTFFNKLMEKLKEISRNEEKTGDDVNIALTDFACRQMGIKKVRDLMPTANTASSISAGNQIVLNTDDEQRLEKLRFLLSHTKVGVDELDAIRSAIEKRQTFNSEPYKTIYSLAEQAFVNFYWTREWESYHDFLMEFKASQNRPDENPSEILDTAELHGQLSEFQNSVERLKVALMWNHSGKSYKDMMDVCTKLKKKLDKSEWTDKFSAAWAKLKRSSEEKETPLMKCMNWVREQEMKIVGFFDDSKKDSPEVSKDSFLSFLWRLQKIRQPSKSDKESMVPQFRKALHYLDYKKRDSFTVSEMKLFHEVFNKTREGIFKDETILNYETKLKTEYVEQYPDHHFLRWIDSYKEITKIQAEISRKWESYSTDSDTASQQAKVTRRKNMLLNRYAAITTFFLSPQKCHEAWRSLRRDMKLDELDQQLRTRVSNTFGNHIQQMVGDVEAALNKIKEGANVQSDGTPAHSSSVSAEDGGGKYFLKQ